MKLDRLPEPALAGGMEAPGTAVPEGGTGETAAPADTENLRQFVNTVKGYSKKNYTAESWAALEEAVKNAEGILNNPNASIEERDAALQALQNAAGALEDQTPDSAQLKAEPEPAGKGAVQGARSGDTLCDVCTAAFGCYRNYRLWNQI